MLVSSSKVEITTAFLQKAKNSQHDFGASMDVTRILVNRLTDRNCRSVKRKEKRGNIKKGGGNVHQQISH